MAGGLFPVDLGDAWHCRTDWRWDIMSARFYRGAQSETKKEAGHSGKHWADDELAIILWPDVSIKGAALMLGRTYASVARRRSRLRRHQHMTRHAELHGAG